MKSGSGTGIFITYFNLAFDLIILLKFSFVTNSSSSSRSAKLEGGCFIWRFATSCFTTSATIRVGSILTLTTPSLVVTLFVGISVLEEAPLAAARERRASPGPLVCEDMCHRIKPRISRPCELVSFPARPASPPVTILNLFPVAASQWRPRLSHSRRIYSILFFSVSRAKYQRLVFNLHLTCADMYVSRPDASLLYSKDHS
jgi:hypothetical protein